MPAAAATPCVCAAAFLRAGVVVVGTGVSQCAGTKAVASKDEAALEERVCQQGQRRAVWAHSQFVALTTLALPAVFTVVTRLGR